MVGAWNSSAHCQIQRQGGHLTRSREGCELPPIQWTSMRPWIARTSCTGESCADDPTRIVVIAASLGGTKALQRSAREADRDLRATGDERTSSRQGVGRSAGRSLTQVQQIAGQRDRGQEEGRPAARLSGTRGLTPPLPLASSPNAFARSQDSKQALSSLVTAAEPELSSVRDGSHPNQRLA
jgi:hypothetical protein